MFKVYSIVCLLQLNQQKHPTPTTKKELMPRRRTGVGNKKPGGDL